MSIPRKRRNVRRSRVQFRSFFPRTCCLSYYLKYQQTDDRFDTFVRNQTSLRTQIVVLIAKIEEEEKITESVRRKRKEEIYKYTPPLKR